MAHFQPFKRKFLFSRILSDMRYSFLSEKNNGKPGYLSEIFPRISGSKQTTYHTIHETPIIYDCRHGDYPDFLQEP